jgi:hypothetical protein
MDEPLAELAAYFRENKKAGPYAEGDRHRQLAERLEGLISQEHAKWTTSQKNPVVPSRDR